MEIPRWGITDNFQKFITFLEKSEIIFLSDELIFYIN